MQSKPLAVGDLGTLIRFVVAYIAVVQTDPFGVLFVFDAEMLLRLFPPSIPSGATCGHAHAAIWRAAAWIVAAVPRFVSTWPLP